MKKASLLLVSLTALLSLASCTDSNSSTSTPDSSVNPSSTVDSSSVDSSTSSTGTSSSTGGSNVPSYIRTALASVKKNNHKANIIQSTRVYYPNATSAYTSIGVGIDNNITVAYSYTDGRAYYTDGVSTHYSTNTEGDMIEGSETIYTTSSTRVFEEEETGLSIIESINPDNTINRAYASNYNSSTGVYTPLVFANEFRNPWDYVDYDDLTEDDDGEIYLDVGKAEFFIESYGLSNTNVVESALVTLDDSNNISSLTFEFVYTGNDSYVRDCTLTINYYDYGEDTIINHINSFTNDNPALETALQCLVGVDSFTYRKQFKYSSSAEIAPNDTTGYFTRDAVFFHQRAQDAAWSDTFYTAGDDYDYVSKRNSADGKYYGYEYSLDSYSFTAAMISSTEQLVIDTFEENGPMFSELSAALFYQTSDLTYEAEPSVVDWMGTYFDNGFDGVHSDILAGSTTSITITLTEDEKAIDTVVVGCAMSGEENTITFTLSDINSTTIPEFAQEEIDAIQI